MGITVRLSVFVKYGLNKFQCVQFRSYFVDTDLYLAELFVGDIGISSFVLAHKCFIETEEASQSAHIQKVIILEQRREVE